MKRYFLAVLLCFLYGYGFAQPPAVQEIREHITRNGAGILQEYRELLRIPNVASDLENIRRNAQWIMDAFRKRGVAMELLELPGFPYAPPVIYGELSVPDAERTLIIYVHYDGQPADPKNWTHDPWEPVLYSASMEQGGKPIPFPEVGAGIDPEWRLYGRSTSDDKAPIPALLAVLDALNRAGIPLSSSLKFFFEGEEEAGSPHLGHYLETYADKLRGDIWLFCDGPKHQSGRPQAVFGVRGVTGLEITVYGAMRSLHSGHYGGWAPVPGELLSRLLSSMKDESGEVLIEGFYETTAPVTQADRDAFATLPDYDDLIRRELGLIRTEFDDRPLIESYMFPAIIIQGIESGNVGDLARNIIPGTATANIGIRLAKGNDPVAMQELVEAHIRKEGFHIVREEPDRETRLSHGKIAKVTRRGGYRAMRTRIDHPLAQWVVSAIDRATDEEVILYPTYGGSLPLFHFEETLGTPLIIVPIANHDNNQHAPDENIRIGNIWYGMEIYGSIFTME